MGLRDFVRTLVLLEKLRPEDFPFFEFLISKVKSSLEIPAQMNNLELSDTEKDVQLDLSKYQYSPTVKSKTSTPS